MDKALVPVVAFLGLWTLTFVFVGIVALIVYRALRSIGGAPADGVQRGDTFLGLAVASALCWPVFPWVGRTLTTMARYLMRWLPAEMMPAFNTSYQACTQAPDSGTCYRTVLVEFVERWTNTTSNFLGHITNDVPYGWLVTFAVFWFAVTQALAAIREADPAKRPPLFRWVVATTRTQKLNAALILSLAIAFYLSVGAIAAIPALTEKGPIPEAEAVKSLETKLDARVPALSSKADEDPFAELEKKIQPASAASPTPETAAGSPALAPTVREDIARAIAMMKSEREDAVARVRQMHTAVENGITSRRQEAIIVYDLNLSRVGNSERRQHFESLSRWYRRTNEEARAGFAQCETALVRGDAAAVQWSRNVEGLLRRNDAVNWNSALFGEGSQLVYERYYNVWPVCREEFTASSAPARPPLGQGLGPFRLVALWLLAPESISLALIVGMIGFGLLGSAVSTFVRESKEHERKPGEPLVEDLAGIVLRGVSAAIVVFLAVEGGLTVFSVGEGDPNPYVLLFTCLVGAVFSERVWAWAREKIITPPSGDGAKPKPEAVKAEESQPAAEQQVEAPIAAPAPEPST